MKHQTCRLNGIVTGAALIAALWIPNWCSAQSRNREFIHSPAVSPAPVTRGTLHPAPPAFSQPKHPWTKPVDRGPLPQINPRGVYRENPDNLIRMWRSQRPMKERQQAVKQSLAGRAQVDQLDRTSPRRNSLVQAALSELATTAAWSQIGSGNWVSPTLPNRLNTGRIRQAAYAYDNSQGATTLWVGATGGGLWRAVPGGPADVTFVSVSDNLPGSPSVGAFLVQPGNSNNILIGSGDAYRYGGTGLYKTTNAGATWYPVEPSDGTSWPGTFQKILIDVSDPTNQTVLAQGNSGIWRSTDFGDHWNQVYAGPASDLVQDPVHPWQWYAGVFYLGVLRSTDYGCSFIPVASGITGPIGRTAVALSPAAPWHVYAMTAALVDGISRSLGGIWRSDDYGETWTAIETTDLISGFGQAFHTTSLNVDPNNPDIVFAGMAEMQVTYNATASAPTWNYSLFGNDIN